VAFLSYIGKYIFKTGPLF